MNTRGEKAPKSPGFASRDQRIIATGSPPNSAKRSCVRLLAGPRRSKARTAARSA